MKQAKSLTKKPLKITSATVPEKVAIKCDEIVEFCVWDLNYQSQTVKAASVKATRTNNILKCVFRDLENKIVLKVEAMGLTQKSPKPVGML